MCLFLSFWHFVFLNISLIKLSAPPTGAEWLFSFSLLRFTIKRRISCLDRKVETASLWAALFPCAWKTYLAADAFLQSAWSSLKPHITRMANTDICRGKRFKKLSPDHFNSSHHPALTFLENSSRSWESAGMCMRDKYPQWKGIIWGWIYTMLTQV